MRAGGRGERAAELSWCSQAGVSVEERGQDFAVPDGPKGAEDAGIVAVVHERTPVSGIQTSVKGADQQLTERISWMNEQFWWRWHSGLRKHAIQNRARGRAAAGDGE